MDGAPHDFIVNHTERERERFLGFKHRTFQADDTLGFLSFLQQHYQNHDTLETAFAQHLSPDATDTTAALIGFHDYFFATPYVLERTRKHVSTPLRGSACKRLCMFLRWMVRSDGCGVDFGLWQNISPAQLVIPLDVHVERQARRLGLLHREKTDWRAALELTENLRKLDPTDPVKYDFALFGLGILAKEVL